MGNEIVFLLVIYFCMIRQS